MALWSDTDLFDSSSLMSGTLSGKQQLLQVFRRTGEPCERCGHPIERIVVAQRSTHLCPVCQKRPKPSHSLT